MAEKVFMFALSPTMESGTILKWNKKEGDTILHNEPICEVETDKSSMEYESMNEGVLLKIVIEEGQSAVVGQTIAIIGKKGEDISSFLKDVQGEGGIPKESAKTQDTKVPTHAQPHTSVSKDSMQHINEQIDNVQSHASIQGRIKVSPLAKSIAEKKGIAIESIQGSGPGGRILKRDIENAPAGGTRGSTAGTAASSKRLPVVDTGQDIVTPVKGVTSIIAQRLSESKFSAPHFYVKNSIRTEAMMRLRNECNASLPEKLSLNAFIIKFVAEAIKQHPEINSSWQENGADSNMIQFASIDIGLAVDLGSGLFTPIVRNCAYKGIQDIDQELKVLIEKVRNKTIAIEEYNGATFTISNLGSFGIDEFTAIINPPGAAILAIGRSRAVPVVNAKGEIETGSIMTVSLSSDHRVINGSLAGRFIAKLQSIIENPGVALL